MTTNTHTERNQDDLAPTAQVMAAAQALAFTTDEQRACVEAHLRARTADLTETVAARIATWNPDLTQRKTTPKQWRAAQPLVRVAVALASPGSEATAGPLLTTAAGITLWAAAEHIPLRLDAIHRDTTRARYLRTVTKNSRATINSHLNTLGAGITTAHITEPPGAPTPSPDENAATAGGEESAAECEPLMLDGAIRPKQVLYAELNNPAGADYLAAAAAVRARVLLIEPGVLRTQTRVAGRGRSVPYGDVELAALLAAATTVRSTKQRANLTALLALGLGAGLVGAEATIRCGRDIIDHPASTPQAPIVAVNTSHGPVPVHAAFVPHLRRAAARAGEAGYLTGGGTNRRNRASELATSLGNANPHLVRLSSTRLAATWRAVHLVRGVPTADILALSGLTSAAALDDLLAYLPAGTHLATARLAGHPETQIAAHTAPYTQPSTKSDETDADAEAGR